MRAVDGLLEQLVDVPHRTDADVVRRASRDMSAVLSPDIAEASTALVAEAVIAPRDEAEVLRVLSACAAHRVPIVARGAGTCNFGQGVPLQGGIVLDLTAHSGLVDRGPGRFRARCGSILAAIDDELQPTGEELRVFPSSKRVGTIGGYVNGGHAGIGAIRHGVLADAGNILGLRVLTAEEEPRVLEVTGEDVNLVHFSFGTAGIVTEVELPTTHAWAWRDVAVSLPTLEASVAFALELALSDGIDVKVVHPVDASVAAAFPLGLSGPAAMAMVAPHSIGAFTAVAVRHGGAVEVDVEQGQGPRRIPVYEYTWGHASWWLRRQHPAIATMLALLPEDDPIRALSALEGFKNVSVKRFGGRPALQVALSVEPTALQAASEHATELGCLVADTHRPVMSASSLYGLPERQRAFARDVDPHGLLNPGKVSEDEGALRADGFSSRR